MKYILFNGLVVGTLLWISPAFAGLHRQEYRTVLAQATVEQPICFAREYSKKHMESHPTQKVRQFRVKISKEAEGDEESSYLRVEAMLKGPENLYTVFRAFLICTNSTGVCAVECDGGNVNLWGNEDGTLGVKNNGFVLQGGCGDDDENFKSLFLEPTKDGDDFFRLSRLPNEACQN